MGNEQTGRKVARQADADAPMALWYVAPGVADLRPASVSAFSNDTQVSVRTLWSGISRGTERLVASGRVPVAEYERMRAPMQEGTFPFPVKYGYCAVGIVEDGPGALAGKTVFALHPHQDHFRAPASMLTPLPAQVPARRGILAANMETALNGLWDSAAGPADRIVVVGAGVIGLLVAYLCARLPGAEVTIVDIDSSRNSIASHLNVRFASPAEAPGEADVVFHTSGHPAGLTTALSCAGLEASVVEMSWFGEGDVAAPLGGAFHSRRLKLVSSQVGHVAPSRRPRWSYARRLAAALDLLADDKLDALITEDVAFSDLPDTIPRILAAGAPGLVTAIRYP